MKRLFWVIILCLAGCSFDDHPKTEVDRLCEKYNANIVESVDPEKGSLVIYASLVKDDVVWVCSGDRATQPLGGAIADRNSLFRDLESCMRKGTIPAKQEEHSKEWKEGYEAWTRWGRPRVSSPYRSGKKRDDWLEGWFARGVEERAKP